MRRSFLLGASALLLIAQAAVAHGQSQPRVTGTRGDFLSSMGSLQKKFEALTEAFPQDKYDWRPGKGVRSVCEVFVHITSENYDIGKAFGGPDAPRAIASIKDDACLGDKAKVKAAVTASFASINNAVLNMKDSDLEGSYTLFGAPLPRRQWLLNTAEHAGEHLGQLIAYARVNNIVPPWSK